MSKFYVIQQLVPNGIEDFWVDCHEAYANLGDAQFDLSIDRLSGGKTFRIVCVVIDDFGNEISETIVPSEAPNTVDNPLITYVVGEFKDLEGPQLVDEDMRVYIRVRAFNKAGEECDATLEYHFTSEGVIIDLHIENEDGPSGTAANLYTDIVESLQETEHCIQLARQNEAFQDYD